MTCREATVTDGVISTDAPDLSTETLERGAAVAKAAGLGRAPRCVVLGVKEQNKPAATHHLRSPLLAILILETEAGQGVADADGHWLDQSTQTLSREPLALSETINLGTGACQWLIS